MRLSENSTEKVEALRKKGVEQTSKEGKKVDVEVLAIAHEYCYAPKDSNT